jgi:hypothetical protein
VIELISCRTWWPIFFWAVQSMLLTANIIFSDIDGAEQLSSKAFRLLCAWALMNAGAEHRASRATTISSIATTSRTTSATRIRATPELPTTRLCPSDCRHLPLHLEGGQRRVCWLCRFASKQRGEQGSANLPKSRWYCGSCDKPLCINEERNCFFEFHTS